MVKMDFIRVGATMDSKQMDAYRYFFPAGWLFGVWGVLLWVLFPWGLVSYPGIRHPEIMMGGFFLCFVCGFLMTAAPRFTASFGPNAIEQRASWVLIGGLFLSLLNPQRLWFLVFVNITFIFLIVFMLRRFWARKANPPDSFIFVGFGLLSGLIGSGIMTLAEVVNVPTDLFNIGRIFFLQTYILCLVLGVGSRLVPALLGWAPLPTERALPPRIFLFVTLGIGFIASYIVEVLFSVPLGNLLRAVVVTAIFVLFWNLYRLPQRKAFQTYWLWASAWMLLLGQWAMVVLPKFRVHLLHVIFISGLALMTLMIAVRVGLSHGKHEMSLEKNSKALFLGAFLILFAGLTRLSAGFAPHIYQSHLLYAAYTWILGMVIWGWIFLPKILRVKS